MGLGRLVGCNGEKDVRSSGQSSGEGGRAERVTRIVASL